MTPKPMSNQIPNQALEQLRDIHEAAPITNLPIALGWWLLLIALLGLTVFLAQAYAKHKKTNAWKAPAMNELEDIRQRYFKNSGLDGKLVAQTTADLSALLRRAMNTRYKDESCLTQTGKEWEATLLKAIPSFSQKEAQTIAHAQYQRQIPKLDHDCFEGIKRWIKSKG